MNKQKIKRLINTENRLIVAGGQGGGLGERVKGLRSTDWQLQNSHRDIKYRTGNIVKVSQ